MQRRVVWIIVTVVLAMTLSACAGGNSSPSNYRTGSQALEMRFFEPSVEIFEGDSLVLILDIHNRGVYDVDDGRIFLKGYDPSYFTLYYNPTPFINIEGKDEFDPTGELSQTITIEDNRVRMPDNRDVFEQEFQAVACYSYGTDASIPVCVDPDPTNRRFNNKVCQGGPVSAGAQGHPVAVTYVEPKVNRNDIRFNIQLSNVGRGQIYDRRISHEKCAYDLEVTDIDKVYVNQVKLSEMTLDCQPANPVKFRSDGTALLACTCYGCLNQLEGAYQSVLSVSMEYGYRNMESAFVRVLSDELG